MNRDEVTTPKSLSDRFNRRKKVTESTYQFKQSSISTISTSLNNSNLRKNLKSCQYSIQSKQQQEDLLYFQIRQSLLSKLKQPKRLLTNKHLHNHKPSLFTKDSAFFTNNTTQQHNFIDEDKDSLEDTPLSNQKKYLSLKLPPRYLGILHQRNNS